MQLKSIEFYLFIIIFGMLAVLNEARTTCFIGNSTESKNLPQKRCKGGCLKKEYKGQGCQNENLIFSCDDRNATEGDSSKMFTETLENCINECCEKLYFCNTDKCNAHVPIKPSSTTEKNNTKPLKLDQEEIISNEKPVKNEEDKSSLDKNESNEIFCYESSLSNNKVLSRKCDTSCMVISYYSNDEKNEYYFTQSKCSEQKGTGAERYCHGSVCKEIEYCNTNYCNNYTVRILKLTSAANRVLFDFKIVSLIFSLIFIGI